MNKFKAPCGCYFSQKVQECPEHGKFKNDEDRIVLDDMVVEFDPENNFCFKKGSKWVSVEDVAGILASARVSEENRTSWTRISEAPSYADAIRVPLDTERKLLLFGKSPYDGQYYECRVTIPPMLEIQSNKADLIENLIERLRQLHAQQNMTKSIYSEAADALEGK